MSKSCNVVKQCSSGGFVTIFVVAVVMLLFIMGSSVVPVLRSENSIGNNFVDGIVAQYLAEAGDRRAIYELNKNKLWAGIDNPGEELNSYNKEGRYTVGILSSGAQSPDVVWVKAVGTKKNAVRQIAFAYVTPPVFAGFADYTLFSGSTMRIGDLNTVKNITMGSRNTVYVDGIVNSQASDLTYINLPIFDRDSYRFSNYRPPSITEIGKGVGLSGLVYYYDSPQNTTYEVNKYQILRGNGVIYATTSIIIGEMARLTGHVRLISERSIIVGRGATLKKALLVAGQNIDMKENVVFTGIAVAGGTLTLGSGAVVERDNTVLSRIQTNYINY